MFDLLRVARAFRSFGFLVGFGRNGAFRAFAVLLACVGIGLALGGANALGAVIALAVWGVVWVVNSRTGGHLLGSSRHGSHRS